MTWILEDCTYKEDGFCRECGEHQRDPDCEHDFWGPIACDSYDTAYTPVEGDPTHHLLSGYAITYQKCEICGYVEILERTPVEETEACNFSYGVCQECRRVNTCEHPNVEAIVKIYGGSSTAIEDNPGYHLFTGLLQRRQVCTVCSEILWRGDYENVVDEVVPCDYRNGYCYECGRDCPHEGYAYTETSWSEGGWFQSLSYENGVHVWTEMLYTGKHCSVCDANYDGEQHNAYTESACTFENGYCTACGAQQPDPECAHVNYYTTTTDAYGTVYTFIEGDEPVHFTSGT